MTHPPDQHGVNLTAISNRTQSVSQLPSSSLPLASLTLRHRSSCQPQQILPRLCRNDDQDDGQMAKREAKRERQQMGANKVDKNYALSGLWPETVGY